ICVTMKRTFLYSIAISMGIVAISSCAKMLEIDEPYNTLTTEKIFSNEKEAENALLGIYSSLIHGGPQSISNPQNAAFSSFGAGLTTYLGGLSGGEMVQGGVTKIVERQVQFSAPYWESAYQTIYFANSLIQGITEVNSPKISKE